MKKSSSKLKYLFWGVLIVFCVGGIFFIKKLQLENYSQEYFMKKNSDHLDFGLVSDYLLDCKNNGKNCSVMPGQSWLADIFWLRSVQSAGQDDFFEYNEFLYRELRSLTDLNPYREYSYLFAQLLLPIQKHSFLNNSGDIHNLEIKSWENTVSLGEKGIEFLCDCDGISCVCGDYELPQALAFSYFYYLNDVENSKKFYGIAASVDGAPEFLGQMSAVVEGRIGDHAKSALLWYQKFQDLDLTDLDNQDQAEYFLKKAAFEYSLYLIVLAAGNADDCYQDLECLQEKLYLQDEILKSKNQCENGISSVIDQSLCNILYYGLDNGFIFDSGNLVYPLGEDFVYGFREDIGDWRVY